MTAGELSYVKDVLLDLVAIADPSEYLKGEVHDAIQILDSLQNYSADLVCEVIEEIDRQELQTIKEIDDHVE